MVTPDVQHVTTESKSKTGMWIEQDEAHQQTLHWVEEANARQAIEISAAQLETTTLELDLAELAEGQITMSLELSRPRLVDRGGHGTQDNNKKKNKN